MAEQIFERCATDEEVRAWMDAEISRLGDQFKGFELTWHRSERLFWLEIWSESTTDPRVAPELLGHVLRVGEVATTEDWVAVPIIRVEGRKLYFQLRKDYRIQRDLRWN